MNKDVKNAVMEVNPLTTFITIKIILYNSFTTVLPLKIKHKNLKKFILNV